MAASRPFAGSSSTSSRKQCAHCGGSLYIDPLDRCLVCLMCGRPASSDAQQSGAVVHVDGLDG